MKCVYFAAIIGAFAATTAHAQCACAPTDSVCLSECGMSSFFLFICLFL